MDLLKVAGAALNQTPLDWKGNLTRARQALEAARGEGVQLLALPELCLSGYGCEDAFHAETVAQRSLESLKALAPQTQGMVVSAGLPLLYKGRLYNAQALLADGALVGLAAKKVLAGYGVYYEPRWFQAWPAGRRAEVELPGLGRAPFGDLVFELDGVRLAFEICEEAWGRELAPGRGRPGPLDEMVDIWLNPSASHFAFGKYSQVQQIVLEGSRQARGVYVYANLLGNEAGRLIFDGAALVASNGQLVAEGPRFSYQPFSLAAAWVDLRANRLERRRLGYPFPEEPPAEPAEEARNDGVAVRCRLAPPPAAAAPDRPMAPAAPLGQNREFALAVALGLFDYLRKSRAQGFAVSLSGGVDSSTVALLCGLMVKLGLKDLGPEGFLARLPHLNPPFKPEEKAPTGAGQAGKKGDLALALTRRLLLTVYQATANSGPVTRQAASQLAQAVGSHHLELELEPVAQLYRQLAAQALGRPLSWQRDDAALQNIQARVRAPSIWLLANVRGLLLLSTSNRSEAGVGYCTMDGDTAGGLAPIAGANKSFLRDWLGWMERVGLAETGPMPQLGAVNRQAPTAELRPPEAGQTDEADLMPYPVLDAIEQAAIRDRMGPEQVWRWLLARPVEGHPMSPQLAASRVERFFRLFAATQWKRERLAPAFHLDDENLDPRTWCRFPILSGGYEQELEDLRQVAAGVTP